MATRNPFGKRPGTGAPAAKPKKPTMKRQSTVTTTVKKKIAKTPK